MKKIFILIALLMFPCLVNAASLVNGINVDGIGDLKLNKNTWNLTLTTTLDYVTIDVSTVSDSVQVEGAGKVSVEEGTNKIEVTVTDGAQTETYTFNIKIVRPSQDGSGNPETGAFVSTISVICLLFGALTIYLNVKSRMYKI